MVFAHQRLGFWGGPSRLLVGLLVVAACGAQTGNRNYTVRPGDSPATIAASQGVDLAALLAANRLTEQSTIQAGTTLILPPAAGVTYKVQPGDNFYRIGQRFGLSAEQIAVANGLTPETILQIGQVLKLPGVTPPKTTGTPAPAPAVSAPAPPAPPTARAAADAVPAAVWVSETRVHLRSQPSTGARSVALLPWGTRLQVTGKSGMWWQVKHPGTGARCYVAGWVVRRTAVGGAPEAPGGGERPLYAFIAQPRVNVRCEPTTESPRLAVAVQGTRMEILADQGGWLKVRFENDTEGWVARPLVRLPRQAAVDEPEASGLGGRLVATAMTFIGTPYVRGGESRSGADCSGLVWAVCREHGINLPRSSRAMWGQGTPIPRDELQPGDLVFFSNTYRSGISHVGVYVGESKFVHAVRSGVRAQVTSLSDSYYANHYAGAYRVTD